MIARTWCAWARPGAVEDFVEHLRRTGLADARRNHGFRGYLLTRDVDGEAVRLTLVTLWTDTEAVRRYAGDAPETALSYAGDDRFLARAESTVRHEEVVDLALA
jgi:heme-degrading monooxygenase HmoA